MNEAEQGVQKCQSNTSTSTSANWDFDRRRTRRLDKHSDLKTRLWRVIPPLFMNARLCHLNPKLRRLLLDRPRHQGIFLTGPVGCGKTYAICSLLRYFLAGRWWNRPVPDIKRIVWDELTLEIRSCYDGGGNEAGAIRRYQTCHVLVIEDLGTSVGVDKIESDFSCRVLLLILNYRLENLLPTFVTSNKTLEEIGDAFGERIESRLCEICKIVKISGPDRRRAALGVVI